MRAKDTSSIRIALYSFPLRVALKSFLQMLPTQRTPAVAFGYTIVELCVYARRAMTEKGIASMILSSNLTIKLQSFFTPGELIDIMLVIERDSKTLNCYCEESYLERIETSMTY
jgi:hypothetical protein